MQRQDRYERELDRLIARLQAIHNDMGVTQVFYCKKLYQACKEEGL